MANFLVDDIKNIFRGQNHLSKLILANAIVFVLLNIVLAFSPTLDQDVKIMRYIGVPIGFPDNITHFWTYFTYMFVHVGLWHFVFNMLWLYWLGRIMADLYGQARVWHVYLYGGLIGGILVTIASYIPGLIGGAYLIGASGGVLAVMVATGVLLPDYSLNLMFIGPVRLKYIALIGFILSTVLNFDENTGGKIAHIGGAAFGLLYAFQLSRGNDITFGINRFFTSLWNSLKPKPRMRVVYRNEAPKRSKRKKTKAKATRVNYAGMTEAERQRKTDEILDKIAKSGYDSLSKEDKDFLFNVSKN